MIGILPQIKMKTDDNPYNDKYEYLDLYCKKIYECGAIPIGICLNNGILDKSTLNICDAFILPGGNKIWDCYYETIIYAIKNNKPLLGICLGFQALDIFSNIIDYDKNTENLKNAYIELKKLNEGTLLNKIDNNNHYKITINYENSTLVRHNINIIDKNSYLYKIYNKEKINEVSLHSYTPKNIGKEFKITAISDDQIVESIELIDDKKFIIGVCYHPEWDNDNLLFKELIIQAKKRLIEPR